MTIDKTGRVVWHDLFTANIHVSMSFHERVAGWHYVTEHSPDFAWGGGEKDYVLACAGDEAGAGFIEQHEMHECGWIPYVEVDDVDSAADRAAELGGTVVTAPFDVPGVGRNCLLRDPAGAVIGICFSRHDFPAPRRQFGAEHWIGRSDMFPDAFYRTLFDWTILPSDRAKGTQTVFTLSGTEATACAAGELAPKIDNQWIPGIRVQRLSEALKTVQLLQGAVIGNSALIGKQDGTALVRDPNGALCYLVEHTAR